MDDADGTAGRVRSLLFARPCLICHFDAFQGHPFYVQLAIDEWSFVMRLHLSLPSAVEPESRAHDVLA